MKKKLFAVMKFNYFFIFFFVIFSVPVYAYIDPSTVTYIIQGVAGIFIAIGAAATIFRHKIKAAWRKCYYSMIARKNEKKQITGNKDDKQG